MSSSEKQIKNFMLDRFSSGGYPTIYKGEFEEWINLLKELIAFEVEYYTAHPSATGVKDFAKHKVIEIEKKLEELTK